MTINTTINLAATEMAERQKLLNDWATFTNKRFPVMIFVDAPFYCKLANIDIADTYKDPR